MPRTIDFDTFRAERKAEPIELKIGGKIYHLPPSLPAAIAIDAIRLKATMGDDNAVPPQELDRIGTGVFGKDTWQAILLEHQLGVDEMGELFKLVLGMYTGATGGEAADPLPSTPPTGTSSSA